jgi:type I restriction enzyme S subunit
MNENSSINLTDICRPKQWKTISISDLGNEGYAVYGANGIIGYFDSYTHEWPTILITCRGATCGEINICLPKSYVNGNAMALDCLDKGVNLKYLYYYLKKRGFKDVISGSAQPQITRQGLNKVKIPLPPLETQKKIAVILDKADELRKNDRKILEKYDQLAQSVFVEMFGDPSKNYKNWPKKPFRYFAKIDAKMTSDFQKYSEYPHIGIGNINQDTGTIHNIKLVKEENLVSGKYLFTNEHIIYSKIRPNLNKVAIPNYSGLCSADAYPILVNKLTTNKYFFTYILRSHLFIDHILKHSKRTNIPKANKSQVESFDCIAPPLNLQDQFADVISNIEKHKFLTVKSLEKSEDLFQSLIQRAFRGELV